MNHANLLDLQHHKAMATASGADPAWLHQARTRIGQLLETGASFAEAEKELRPLCEPLLAAPLERA